MWILLEGIDGAGKTKTAELISAKVPNTFGYWHVGPPGSTGNLVDGSWPSLARTWYEEHSRHLIWDRAHLGELVYGLDRGFTPDSVENRGWLRLLEAILINKGSALIWLARDPREAWQAQAHREDARSLTDLMALHYRYSELGSHLTLEPSIVESEEGPEHVADKVPKVLEKLDPERTHVDHEGVGSRTPMVWVVGEQRSPAAWSPAPFATASGVELVWPCISPCDVRVSNVLRPDWDLREGRRRLEPWQAQDLQQRWGTLGEPQVICLGHTAKNCCIAAGVPIYADLEHPQYSRRFYYHAGPDYRERLIAALRGALGDDGLKRALNLTAVLNLRHDGD